jgi:hypothetical protein
VGQPIGAVSAIVTLAPYGVLQAVDGVALKQAVDAWVSAPDAERRLASRAPRQSGGWNGAYEAIRASCWVCRSSCSRLLSYERRRFRLRLAT